MSSSARTRAFTLMEVLIAIALITLLLGGVLSFGWTLADRRVRIVEGVRESLATSGVFDRLEAELHAAVAGDPVLGAGVVGDETTLRIISRAVWLVGPDDGEQPLPAGDAGAPAPKAELGDLIAVEYRFAPPESGQGSGAGASATGSTAPPAPLGPPQAGRLGVKRWLMEPGASPPPADAAVSERVRAVRFRYFDGRTWRASFDSLKAGGLPAAIELSLWMSPVQPPSAAQASAAAPGRQKAAPAQDELGPPDRLRVIAVPDGGVGDDSTPESAGREGRP